MHPLPSSLPSVLGILLACSAGPAVARGQDLLGIHYDTGVLYRISTSNASAVVVGPTGVDKGGAAALMFAPDGFLYTFDEAHIPFFYRIDPATAATTYLCGPKTGNNFYDGAMAMDPSGAWPAWAVGEFCGLSSQMLFRFDPDPASGCVTSSGPCLTPSSNVNGIAFRSDGQLVGIERNANSLIQIDTSTGTTTTIASIAPALGVVGGMAVLGGTAYFCTGGPSSGGTNELYRVDLFSGAIQLVGSLAPAITGNGISGLAESPGSWFSSLCYGDGSGAACPCGNSGSPGSGCENSSSTGGALLEGTGTAVPDAVVLHASGEKPTALTIFLQGNAVNNGGLVFGDGLRCATGVLKRLYVKNATNGSVSAPGAGDPSITARSAALGDPIPPGERRYYQTYYRDSSPTFCPAPQGSTFNASHAVKVVW